MTDKDYRQGVYALILENNSILMVQKKSNGMWDFPGGGIDEGESIEQAIKREILEELGISKIDLIHIGKTTNKYDWPEKEIEKHFNKTGILRKGQEQNFVVFKYLAIENNINLQEEELLNYKWIPFSELKQNMSYQDQFETVQSLLAEINVTL
jgi:putative (di)nucleoside polyphosphate hydrolase